MLRNTARDIVANRIGSRTDLNDRIVTEMQLVQTRLELLDTLPWFLDKLTTGLTATAGSAVIATPDGFLREKETNSPDWGGCVWYYDPTSGKRKPIHKEDFGKLYSSEELQTTGAPQYYAFVKDDIYIFPPRDVDYTVDILHYAADAALSTDLENQWLKYAPDLVIAETCLYMAEHVVAKPQLVQQFQTDVNAARDRLWRMSEARENSNRAYDFGG